MKKVQRFSAIVRLLGPIRLIKGHWFIWFGEKIYDSLQGIFEPWIAAWIIAAIVRGDRQGVIFGTLALIITKLIQQGYAILATFSCYTLMSHLDHYLSAEFFKKYLYFDNNRTEAIGTGKINSIVTRGVEGWINIIYDTFPNIIAEILTILIGFVIIFFSVPVMYSMILLLLFTVAISLMVYAQNKIQDSRTEAGKVVTELQKKRTQIIMSKFEIFQNNKLAHELSLSQEFTFSITKLLIRSNVVIELFNGTAATIMILVQAGIYLVIGMGVIRGDYSVATLVLLSGLTMTVYKYFWSIQRTMNNYNRYVVGIDQLLDLMDNTPIIQEDKDLPFFSYGEGNIHIEHLGFAYESSKQIFNEFSLALEGGRKYALVGPSGGGKTTLMKLIAGYIHPNSGNVVVDDQKLSEISLQSYYRHIGYLTQEPNVFDGTIFKNLTYALSEEELRATQLGSRIAEVVTLAKCEFVWEFENKLETEIGERGVRLSGGQKQRLAIAKIMLKNPEIILLDEPTSALDSINEEAITEALNNLFKGRTVMIVAHRLQTVKQSDVIFYIEDGKILEQGSHSELVSKEGKYKKMLDLQSGF